MLFGNKFINFRNPDENVRYYVARDKNGMVCLYSGQAPFKENGTWHFYRGKTELLGGWHDEDGRAFPNVLWSDNFPTEVELFVRCV